MFGHFEGLGQKFDLLHDLRRFAQHLQIPTATVRTLDQAMNFPFIDLLGWKDSRSSHAKVKLFPSQLRAPLNCYER